MTYAGEIKESASSVYVTLAHARLEEIRQQKQLEPARQVDPAKKRRLLLNKLLPKIDRYILNGIDKRQINVAYAQKLLNEDEMLRILLNSLAIMNDTSSPLTPSHLKELANDQKLKSLLEKILPRLQGLQRLRLAIAKNSGQITGHDSTIEQPKRPSWQS